MGIKRIEHTIQVRVVQFVRVFHPDVLLFAIPNGANMRAIERVNMVKEGLLAGVPDLFLAHPLKGFNGLFIELKTMTGVESDKQRKMRKALTKKGYLCYVARSHETAIELIQDYLK